MATSKYPLVSIIIPCYNYGRYVAGAIDSALAQSYPNIELLVIDDGSTDNTRQVVERYGDKLAYYYKSNGGLSDTRNFGLQKIRGEYVVFLDADDELDRDYVTKTMAVLAGQHAADKPPARLSDSPAMAGFVYTQMQHFGADDRRTHYPAYDPELLKWQNYIHASALCRSDALRQVRYDTRLRVFDDWDMYLSLLERGVTGVLLDEPLLRYRKHAGGANMLGRIKKDRKVVDAHRLRMKHWRLYGPARTVLHVVWYTLFRLGLAQPKLRRLAG